MSDTKFTKGKWFPCFGSYEVAVLNGKGFIENLITDTGPQSIPNDDEAMANQHLIAAAPDMYAIIEELTQRGFALLNVDEFECEEDRTTIHSDFNDEICKALNVLKSARGE